MTRFIRMLMTSLILAACATPYQSAGLRGGYSEEAVAQNQYLVRFKGNGHTSAFTVKQYALRRAKELCQENGFDGYRVLDGESSARTYTTPVSYNCNGATYGNTYNGTCRENGGSTVSKHLTEVLIECQGNRSTASTHSFVKSASCQDACNVNQSDYEDCIRKACSN